MGKLVTDQPSYQLPIEDFNKAENLQYSGDQVETTDGHGVFFTSAATAYHIRYSEVDNTGYWIYTGLTDAYIYDGATQTVITRASTAYTGAVTNKWNSCAINKALVFNNHADVPQMMTSVNPGTLLEDLAGWTSVWKAKVIRSYKYFLVALNVTKSGAVYKDMVKWSDAADSGTVPASWDETSATVLAGEKEISETEGEIVDGLHLRDEFFIYKTDSVFGMQHVGGTLVFNFRRLKDLPGLLSQNCAVNFSGGHFCISGPTERTIYINDGQSYTKIGLEVKEGFFDSLDPVNYRNTFCIHLGKRSEIWVYFPSVGSTFCDRILIWNYQYNKWSFRDTPEVSAASIGVVDITSTTWASSIETWASITGTWDSAPFSPTNRSIVTTGTDGILYKHGDGNQFSGVNATCTLERTGMSLGENEYRVHINRIYPHASGGAFDFYIGTQNSPNSSVTWEGPYSFDPSTDYKIDVSSTGMLHSVRFTSTSDVKWSLTGYDIAYKPAGKR